MMKRIVDKSGESSWVNLQQKKERGDGLERESHQRSNHAIIQKEGPNFIQNDQQGKICAGGEQRGIDKNGNVQIRVQRRVGRVEPGDYLFAGVKQLSHNNGAKVGK